MIVPSAPVVVVAAVPVLGRAVIVPAPVLVVVRPVPVLMKALLVVVAPVAVPTKAPPVVVAPVPVLMKAPLAVVAAVPVKTPVLARTPTVPLGPTAKTALEPLGPPPLPAPKDKAVLAVNAMAATMESKPGERAGFELGMASSHSIFDGKRHHASHVPLRENVPVFQCHGASGNN
jgi:hypothetical protein